MNRVQHKQKHKSEVSAVFDAKLIVPKMVSEGTVYCEELPEAVRNHPCPYHKLSDEVFQNKILDPLVAVPVPDYENLLVLSVFPFGKYPSPNRTSSVFSFSVLSPSSSST